MNLTVANYLAEVGVSTTPGSFGLHAVLATDASGNPQAVNLSWTWPAGLLAAWGSALALSFVTLQRSTTASNRPNPALAYQVGTNTTPAPDPNWTTVQQWSGGQYISQGFPVTFSDPWTVTHPVCYRLILNFARGGDPVLPPFYEMAWNVALVVPAQPLNIVKDNTQPRITFTPPDVSWWP